MNDSTIKSSLPKLMYKHVAAVARRIEECHRRFPMEIIKMLKGDVKSIFRHLMLHFAHV